ncbi:MAG: hypothetical protein QXQ81_09810, partial [Candidatus Thorarchaeota archaeon]
HISSSRGQWFHLPILLDVTGMKDTDLTHVDFLTFHVSHISAEEGWKNSVLDLLGRLNSTTKRKGDATGSIAGTIADIVDNAMQLLSEEENPFAKIPLRNSFPSFFTSLADYCVISSCIAVTLVVECLERGLDFTASSKNTIVQTLVKDRGTLINLTRLLCLLQTIYRFPGVARNEASEKIRSWSEGIGLGQIIDELESISLPDRRQAAVKNGTATALQWVIELADGVAGYTRAPIPARHKEFAEALLALAEVCPQERQLIEALAHTLQRDSFKDLQPDERIRQLLLLDDAERKRLSASLRAPQGLLPLPDRPVAVLVIEAEAIQSIVRRTESLRGLFGFSALVESAMRKIAQAIARRLSPENVIFVGGGSLMALVPPSIFDRIVQESASIYWEELEYVGTIKAPYDSSLACFSLHELVTYPEVICAGAPQGPQDLPRRTFARIYGLVVSTLEPVYGVGYLRRRPGKQTLSPTDRCSYCGLEYAHAADRQGHRVGKICQRAIDMRDHILGSLRIQFHVGDTLSGGRSPTTPPVPTVEIMQRIAAELQEIVRMNDSLAKGVQIVFETSPDLDRLGNRLVELVRGDLSDDETRETIGTDIAVIQADGDNFGSLKSSMTTIGHYRALSRLLERTINDTLSHALACVLARQLELYTKKNGNKIGSAVHLGVPFLIVYSGGDDFLLLLDASAVFIFLKAFASKLKDRLGKRINRYDSQKLGTCVSPVGVSMGVCLAKSRSPLYMFLEAVEELESRAKKRSKKETQSPGAEVTVALHRFTGIPSREQVELHYELKDNGLFKVFYTAWPRNSEEIFGDGGLVPQIRKLLSHGIGSGALQRVFRNMHNQPQEVIKYTVRYKAARDKENERSTSDDYKELARTFVKTYPDTPPHYVFLDLIDAMRIVCDSENLLEGPV